MLGKHGFGVLATEDLRIEKGKTTKSLGIYWGELSTNGGADSNYVFVVSKYEVDAEKYGGWTRFVNHSKGNYNVVALEKSFKLGKLRLPYIEYALLNDVKAGEQLLVDYGPDYEFDPKHQIFLNPSNNENNVADFYRSHRSHYCLLKGELLTVCQQLIPKAEKLYIPRSASYAELPILQANKKGQLLQDRKQHGLTLLMLAAYLGKVKQVIALLQNDNVNVNQENANNGYNALFYALQSQVKPAIKKRIVTLLLNANINIETQDKNGLTALHWCAKLGLVSLLKLMLSNKHSKDEAKVALRLRDREGLTPRKYPLFPKL